MNFRAIAPFDAQRASAREFWAGQFSFGSLPGRGTEFDPGSHLRRRDALTGLDTLLRV
jgi:hypothetical protein